MDTLSTFSFCSVIFSVLFTFALFVRVSSDANIFEPNSVLPPQTQSLFGGLKSNQISFVNPDAPWVTSGGQRVIRLNLKCLNQNCVQYGFALVLPRITNPETTENAWSSYANGWNLTLDNLLTGHDTSYPFATLLDIPSDCPANVQFISDAFDDAELKVNVLNVKGPWPPSFTIINNAKAIKYFTRTVGDLATYWKLRPNTKTLVWFDGYWRAYTFDSMISNIEAAYVTENLMFSRV